MEWQMRACIPMADEREMCKASLSTAVYKFRGFSTAFPMKFQRGFKIFSSATPNTEVLHFFPHSFSHYRGFTFFSSSPSTLGTCFGDLTHYSTLHRGTPLDGTQISRPRVHVWGGAVSHF